MDRRHDIMPLVHANSESASPQARLRRRVSSSAFTLVELMVVVIIISVVAALAIPNITRRMQERRASEAAQRIALLYQMARTQAMSRGAAVLVRYSQPTSQGAFEVRSAQRGVAIGSACVTQPVTSCATPDWNNAAAQQFHSLSLFDLGQGGVFEKIKAQAKNSTGTTNINFLDVCFTPMGRTFSRVLNVGAFQPLAGLYRIDVARDAVVSFGGVGGRVRTVMVLPNSGARLQ
jgi:type IV fimbrial biogenesis protein FimT